MALLLGKQYCKIDSNGRFKYPIELKRQLDTEDNRFVMRRSMHGECVELWTYARFEEEIQYYENLMRRYGRAESEFRRLLNDGNEVSLDNNDRLTVPPEQKAVLGDAKEIVLQPVGRFIEIWNREVYNKMMDELRVGAAERLEALMDKAEAANHGEQLP